jgi:hypothetical protein
MTVSFPFIENILVVIWNKDYGETKEENWGAGLWIISKKVFDRSILCL